MRLASLVLAGSLAMTACSESGAGTVVRTFARLPVASGYTVGFGADGTPLLGFTSQAGPIARVGEDGQWLPLSQAMVFVFAFGSDRDGTPLVGYRTPAQELRVAQLVGDQLVDVADGTMPTTAFQLLQQSDGTRYAVAGGFAMRLAPGSRTWTSSNIDMIRAAVTADGSILAWTSSQGLVRVGANDTATPVLACQALGPNGCGGGALFGGVDDDGRLYFATFQEAIVFEPGNLGTPTKIVLPQGEQPVNLIATGQLALMATFGSNQQLYALPRGATRAVPVRTDEVLGGQGVSLQADLDGTIYVSHGDWLGLASVIAGD